MGAYFYPPPHEAGNGGILFVLRRAKTNASRVETHGKPGEGATGGRVHRGGSMQEGRNTGRGGGIQGEKVTGSRRAGARPSGGFVVVAFGRGVGKHILRADCPLALRTETVSCSMSKLVK